MAKPKIGITVGDFNGIGPEIALKSILSRSIRRICYPFLIGPLDVYEHYARILRLQLHFREVASTSMNDGDKSIPVLNILPHRMPVIATGTLTKESGLFSGEAIALAARLCMQHNIDGMVTSPVSKEAMAKAGYRFAGQTEMLAEFTHSKRVVMMLVAGTFRIGLATVHVPLKNVSSSLTVQTLVSRIAIIHDSLRHDFAIRRPHIALLGVNPHAGEHGMFGSEELDIIAPAIKRLRRKGIHTVGPFPADGFFGRHSHRNFDVVIAMYHDQGLIPLKMSGFSLGVNYSAGLRIVRTSPDHGTAFDIAGKGVADPGSMMEAIKLAARVISHRRKTRR